ncbi:MAG TPA: DUF192 domain-containing protein [Candidatus Nanoarchaeia archaeon]|nr:DUF192 domain-containing protein [Candidatus Nanoarchaeia archaeon]
MRRALLFFVVITLASCSSLQPLTIHSASGDHVVGVDIADSIEERARGLMNVSYLPEDQGMLFIFEEEGIPRFWMKDTLISLDLIFISKKKEIVSIIEGAQPEQGPEYTIHSPEKPVLYVLELNAGWAAEQKLKKGDKIIF